MKYNYLITCGGTHGDVLMSVACSKCASGVDLGDKFCRRCGHKLEPLPERMPAHLLCEMLTEQVRKHPGAFSPEPKDKEKGKKK